MHLHHDKEAFEELIIGAANELHIPANVIEKDYFVTLTLKELSTKLKDMVFKGGTSLTKCYQLLDRFSEDIDLSYTAESGVPGDARKKQLKKAVVSTLESLELTINNLEDTRSRRNYNCYRASYPSMYDNSPFLKQELVLETYVALLPFPITTQAMERTLVDKVFAICDYYLDNKTGKHSRHLYDIHKIYTNMEIPEYFCDLIASVRSLRSYLAV